MFHKKFDGITQKKNNTMNFAVYAIKDGFKVVLHREMRNCGFFLEIIETVSILAICFVSCCFFLARKLCRL